MKTVRQVLQDADPLPHESGTSSEEREYRRRTILAAASKAKHEEAQPRSRLTLLVTLACAMVVVLVVAERMWSPLVSNVYAAPVRFEVKLAEEKPGPGLREAKVPGTDRSVYLHPDDIVTNSDVSRAYVIEVDHSSRYNVGVEFNSSGTEKVRAATAKHIGKPVAILLDGQIVMIATVRDPIGGSAVISGDLSKADAERIVTGIMKIRELLPMSARSGLNTEVAEEKRASQTESRMGTFPITYSCDEIGCVMACSQQVIR